MNQTLEIIYQVCGGLGIFLLGMKNMSEGMQAVAGERLRRMIGAVTNNRLMACGLGTVVTMIIQSSSVTTVMVVGLVNAGLMTLVQAIGVILGANIGTTITAWILVINLGKYGLPLLGAASLFYLFTKRDKIRFTAMFLMGIGMVFFGLELMKNGFGPIKDMPEFIAWFRRFHPDNYLGIWKCILTGAVLTAVVQSSSATVGITMGLAYTGAIHFPTAMALILGENIGTTVTAYLASLGAGTNARRAAYSHFLFKVIGVCLISLIFPWFLDTIGQILTQARIRHVKAIVITEADEADILMDLQQYKIPEQNIYRLNSDGLKVNSSNQILTDKDDYALARDLQKAAENQTLADLPIYTKDQTIFPYTQPAIALTHSVFNILNTLFFLPLIGPMAAFLSWAVKEKKAVEKPRLTYLTLRMLNTPALGIQQSFKEVIRMGQTVIRTMDLLKTMLTNEELDIKREEEIFQVEKDLDVIQMEVVEFLGDILSGNISHDVILESQRQIRMADEYESISDYIVTILKLRLKLRDHHLTISPEGIVELNHLHDIVDEHLHLIQPVLEQGKGSLKFFSEVQTKGATITNFMKQCRGRHLVRVGDGQVSPLKSLIYTDMLSAYRRIKDHALNIAEVLMGEK